MYSEFVWCDRDRGVGRIFNPDAERPGLRTDRRRARKAGCHPAVLGSKASSELRAPNAVSHFIGGAICVGRNRAMEASTANVNFRMALSLTGHEPDK